MNWIYDVNAASQVTRETRTIGGVSSAVTYGWDPGGSGRLNTMTLPSGIMIAYSYDALGRPTLLSGSLGTVISSTPLVGNITYFPFGGVQQIGYSNGVARFESDDLQYRINGLFLTQGAKVLMQRYFSFDDNLNLTQINTNATDSKQSQSLNYDAAQRLTYAAGAYGSRLWQYDTVGNRLSEARTPAGSSTATTSTFTYPTTSNLLTTVTQGTTTTRAFTYDAAGNTTQDSRSGTAYNYVVNDAGRIAQVTIGTTVTANYTYDAKDRLSVRQTLNMSPAGTTRFIYDIWDHLLAETTATGQPVRDYVWLGDEPVAVADWTVTAGSPTLFFVHTDHLHRPELMTDTSGKVVWQASYEPFGTVSSVTGTLTENQRFPGQWFQIEAGLHYNWHRHYDPTIGRYTSPDPLGARSAGPSIHGYVGQNPLIFTDKEGLSFWDWLFPPSPPVCTNRAPDEGKPLLSGSDEGPGGPPASSGPPNPTPPPVDPNSPALRPDYPAQSGGRSGSNVKNLNGPPDSVIPGSGGNRAYVTDGNGNVIKDLTPDRAKDVKPGQGFNDKRPLIDAESNILKGMVITK